MYISSKISLNFRIEYLDILLSTARQNNQCMSAEIYHHEDFIMWINRLAREEKDLAWSEKNIKYEKEKAQHK